ncbi:Rne/Rng family ribonuclease [Blastococcus goldschmidtiae]|uniref:Rne/Rng family ribonuclease n=1 Tax=Blastococcus goldschmidtiae TaxID=3075546 RepID=A0ABU2K712_9ACTN|nr:Rne/Rng family ribonuclease [Blastococcus sp. DSM 46792]MDT0275956.1 Rne/Rng family ribonuclease [Blastococcus sp. DSM 46792]
MADTDNSTHSPAEENPTGPRPDDTVAEIPAVSEDSSVPEDPEDEAADAPVGETPAAPEPEADPEPVGSPFGAQFSSPEPTAVVARPRRRATRPVAAPDPDAVEPVTPAAPAAPVPAFVSFMAPPADPPPAPRRRSRRPVESPEVESEGAEAPEGAGSSEEEAEPTRGRQRSRRRSAAPQPVEDVESTEDDDSDDETSGTEDDGDSSDGSSSRRRRRGRRGRGRGRTGDDSGDGDEENGEQQPVADGESDSDDSEDTDDESDGDSDEASGGSSTRRRRRRRRRSGGGGDEASDDTDDDDRPERAGRNGRTTSDDDVRGVAGSTRLEAKRQRRRDGRDTGRRRAPILTESEFLARREAVDRKMVIRQRGERTQIAVLEDDVLVEHYVTQAQATSFAGNVYLGRVQNVLPSMEAAFIDIGKGRNAVLYAGEVNWDAAGLSGKQRSIETAMKSGDKVLVQVTKDPIGHKGARLTQQINLPGRFLVYVPGGSMTGISRKLPDTERQRLKDILKRIVPEDAGVIIRTAAEGASEEELTRDVNRLKAQWEVISQKAGSTSSAPTLLYGEPDLAIRVIRDVFNEDFKDLVVQGDDAWDTVEAYVKHVSPELSSRLSRYTGQGDVFHDLRIDEQLAKALDRKVWLPSGGSLVIDRTEAMTVVDVNTGKFVGSGGNLEQTVTRNNMEAAEEIVRQLRLRDIGGIIVIDFIDMVLESNRDLVLRRLTECLGRDRTKHQVAEVTSLGLVQMTRKRVGQGLLEVFSENCEHCRGRGIIVSTDPVDERRRSGNGGGNAGGGNSGGGNSGGGNPGGGNSGKGDSSAGGGRRDRSGKADNGGGSRDDAAAEQGAGESTSPAEPAVDGDGETAEGTRSGGRRNRGRRNRGQSGEERAAADAAVLAGAGDDARDTTEDSAGDDASDSADVAASEPAPVDDTQPDDVPTPATVEPVNAEAEAGPTRPQRAASDVVVVPPLAVAEPVQEQQDGAEVRESTDLPEAAPEIAAPEVAALEAAASQAAPAEPAAAAGRPRRRRAASRPAGPPVV